MLFVLMFEWLTLLATRRCLPQIAHCAGITFSSERRVPLPSTDENRKAGRGRRAGACRLGRQLAGSVAGLAGCRKPAAPPPAASVDARPAPAAARPAPVETLRGAVHDERGAAVPGAR